MSTRFSPPGRFPPASATGPSPFAALSPPPRSLPLPKTLPTASRHRGLPAFFLSCLLFQPLASPNRRASSRNTS